MLRPLAWTCLGLAVALNLGAADKPSEGGASSRQDWADCLACHKMAGEKLPKLSQIRPTGVGTLTEDACLGCHSNLDLSQTRSQQIHKVRPVGEHLDCLLCHQAVPHSSQAPPPVPVGDYNAEGCYSCHRSVDAQQHMYSRHSSSASVRCIDCHPAHEPFEAGLPLDILPPRLARQQLGRYDYHGSNGVCLQCHGPAQLFGRLDEGFVVLNTTNYHELHVMGGQCLCIECHEPHGGVFKSMLRSTLMDGEALGFRQRPDGGSCAVRCHGVEHDELGYVNRVF